MKETKVQVFDFLHKTDSEGELMIAFQMVPGRPSSANYHLDGNSLILNRDHTNRLVFPELSNEHVERVKAAESIIFAEVDMTPDDGWKQSGLAGELVQYRVSREATYD